MASDQQSSVARGRTIRVCAVVVAGCVLALIAVATASWETSAQSEAAMLPGDIGWEHFVKPKMDQLAERNGLAEQQRKLLHRLAISQRRANDEFFLEQGEKEARAAEKRAEAKPTGSQTHKREKVPQEDSLREAFIHPSLAAHAGHRTRLNKTTFMNEFMSGGDYKDEAVLEKLKSQLYALDESKDKTRALGTEDQPHGDPSSHEGAVTEFMDDDPKDARLLAKLDTQLHALDVEQQQLSVSQFALSHESNNKTSERIGDDKAHDGTHERNRQVQLLVNEIRSTREYEHSDWEHVERVMSAMKAKDNARSAATLQMAGRLQGTLSQLSSDMTRQHNSVSHQLASETERMQAEVDAEDMEEHERLARDEKRENKYKVRHSCLIIISNCTHTSTRIQVMTRARACALSLCKQDRTLRALGAERAAIQDLQTAYAEKLARMTSSIMVCNMHMQHDMQCCMCAYDVCLQATGHAADALIAEDGAKEDMLRKQDSLAFEDEVRAQMKRMIQNKQVRVHVPGS